MSPQDIEEAERLASGIFDAQEAGVALGRLLPRIEDHAPDPRFLIACGMLVEKLRQPDGMLEFWDDLCRLCPGEQVPIRLLMRWYRRLRRVDEAIARIDGFFPRRNRDVAQAIGAISGLAELHAYEEIDKMMASVLAVHPDAPTLRLRYIKALAGQNRYLEAARIAAEVKDRSKLSPSWIDVLALVEKRAATLAGSETQNGKDIMGDIVRAAPAPRQAGPSPAGLGKAVFFTGQLGAGGAERQMSRLAAAFAKRHATTGMAAGDIPLLAPMEVCVRHASPSSGSDFFLPVLQQAGVPTTILTDYPDVPLASLGLGDKINAMMELLPDDLIHHTSQMVRYYRETGMQVAYLWQDGGVLVGALAAVLAGVPRIVTSFRGLPPNLRPELFRPQMPALYKALADLPHVTFSANSLATARAYEAWLGLPDGVIRTVLNATYPITPEGDPDEQAWWRDIAAKSAECDRTVVGIFRFDHNKRPKGWITQADLLLRERPDTRFVIVGGGFEFEECQKLITDLGRENRIFLAGLRANVGFFLHKADLLMHLARMEGLPNVVIEAQLAGKPVLATPAGGTAEIVTHGVTGHVLSDADTLPVAEITESLRTMLDDGTALQKMGAAAKKLAEPRFLVDAVMDRTIDLFLNTKAPS